MRGSQAATAARNAVTPLARYGRIPGFRGLQAACKALKRPMAAAYCAGDLDELVSLGEDWQALRGDCAGAGEGALRWFADESAMLTDLLRRSAGGPHEEPGVNAARQAVCAMVARLGDGA
jgi:hypothetical protein